MILSPLSSVRTPAEFFLVQFGMIDQCSLTISFIVGVMVRVGWHAQGAVRRGMSG